MVFISRNRTFLNHMCFFLSKFLHIFTYFYVHLYAHYYVHFLRTFLRRFLRKKPIEKVRNTQKTHHLERALLQDTSLR